MIVVLVLALGFLAVGEEVSKCCTSDQVFQRVQDTFQCVRDVSRRAQVRANSTEATGRGRCVEALNEEFFEFDVGAEKVVMRGRVSVGAFRKCCPLNQAYDSRTHSCVESDLGDLFGEGFVKVGLPECKVVTDVLLNGTESFEDVLHGESASRCIDKNQEGGVVVRECGKSVEEVCGDRKCVRKCCPDGKSFVNGAKCLDTYKYGLNLTVFGDAVEDPDEPFSIIYNRTCKQIYMMRANQFKFFLDRRGRFTEYTKKGRNLSEDVYNTNSYCIEHTKRSSTNGYFFFRCAKDKETDIKFDITFWPFVMSCAFLTLTIFVYVILNETKKMFGKILVNYCVAMLFVFASLALAQTNKYPERAECTIKAYSIIFFAISSFTWSNIMCWDIWCTFGSTRRYLGRKKKSMELKKLMFYSLYGWGTPMILTLVIIFFHKWKILPYPIQPLMAEVRCFFDQRDGNYSKVLFFDTPLFIIQLVNLVLFTKTVMYCLEVKNEINKVNDTTKDDKKKKYQRDKERLFLILKLMVIMSMSHIFETISAFFDMSKAGFFLKYMEIIWDTINALQGVFIFIIFICKKKILARCLEKFHLIDAPIHISNSSSLHTQSSVTLNGLSLMNVFSSLSFLSARRYF